MRILAIGDIHGKTIWRKAVDQIDADVIVFIGDYVKAARWFLNAAIDKNLSEIIAFKRSNFQHVHVIIGNHDFRYLYDASLVRRITCRSLHKTYHDNLDCFEVAFQHNNFLFTHAGVTRHWYHLHNSIIEKYHSNNLAKTFNRILQSNDSNILWEKGKARGGNLNHGGIIFADRSETQTAPLPHLTQIVGHTKVPSITSVSSPTGKMIYIDCLNSKEEVLLIENGECIVQSL